MRSIYLDYCTTTPVAASVRECMLPFLSELFGHPASSHWFGRAAEEAIEDARSNLSTLLGCHPSEIVFTSGGTESTNLGLLGVAKAIQNGANGAKPHLITSALEHMCVRQCAAQLERDGWDVTSIGCDRDGVVRVDELQQAITASTRIVSIIHASHRIGTIQPIADIGQICKQRDILFHTDASQSIGKVASNVDELGVDLLSLSGHKFYAPKGIGALYIRTGVPVEPILYGEGCEAGIRPGTANVPHIAGLGQAAKLAQAGLESTLDQTLQMRNRFLSQLENAIGREIPVHGANVERLPSILSFELPGVLAAEVHQMLPEICFGSCSTNGNGKSGDRTHAAMGLSESESRSTLRVSIGWTTSEEELQRSVQMIATAYESLRT